jgi:hypothetical protein
MIHPVPRPPLRVEVRRAGGLEEVAAASILQRRTVINKMKKLTRSRGGRGGLDGINGAVNDPRRENGKGCNSVFYHGLHGLKRISRIKWA